MPTIPTYGGQRVERTQPRVAPLPNAALTVQAPPDAFNEGKGFATAGAGLMTAGDALMREYQREQDEIDNARVQDAYTKLSKAGNDSIYGDAGVTRMVGQSAVGVADKWANDFGQVTETIAGELTPRQQALFRKNAATLQRGFYDNVLRHESQQVAQFKDDAYKNLLTVAQDTAATSYRDGQIVGVQTGIAIDALRRRPEYVGASSEVRATMEQNLRASFNAAVIDAALTKGDTAYANEYFTAVGKDMPLAIRSKVEARLKPATDFEEGRTLALATLDKLAAGTLTTAEAERELASKAKTKESMAVAQSVMREMQDAQKRQAAHASGSFIERFENAPTRATMLTIQRDKAFQSLEPEDRARLVKYMRAEVEQQDDRARARRNEAYRTPEAFAKFLDVMESPDFAKRTRQELYALRTELGPELTGKLLSEHKNAQTAAGAVEREAKRFQIDKDLLNEALPREAAKDKEKERAFRGIVESELSRWKAANPGKVPDLEQQKAIARSATAEWIEIGRLWNSTVPRYAVEGKDVRAVPRDFYDQSREWAKANGRPIPTDDQILAAWQKVQKR